MEIWSNIIHLKSIIMYVHHKKRQHHIPISLPNTLVYNLYPLYSMDKKNSIIRLAYRTLYYIIYILYIASRSNLTYYNPSLFSSISPTDSKQIHVYVYACVRMNKVNHPILCWNLIVGCDMTNVVPSALICIRFERCDRRPR